MNNTAVYNDLREILTRVSFQQPKWDELKADQSLQNDLNVDSLMLVEIVLDIEERYSIQVPEEEMNRLRTVGDLAELISGSSSK